MNTAKHITGMLLAAVMLFVSVSASCVYAGENIPVAVDIPITYIVNGNVSRAGGDYFTLEADDPASPMPSGAKDGSLTIKISRKGKQSFGEICYEGPGVHWYTVSREIVSKDKGVRKDRSVYRVKVIALNNGKGHIIVKKKGGSKKTDLVYTDSVAPKTGDTNDIIILATVFGTALAFLLYFAVRRHERK